MGQLQTLIEEFLHNMGIQNPQVSAVFLGTAAKIQISLDDAGFMIGKNGENISDIERVLKLLAKHSNIDTVFSIDINNYRSEREGKLKEYIRKIARQVVTTKKEVRLPPMKPFERRIIHLELAVHPDIITESKGEGDNRYVTIRPYNP
ncbi:MAG: hypothetical protein KGI50_04235 [Patescibacteria group bacterium]|nr:hypothetical protein [Patescibacteria group bacterium]MDE2438505.1 hypothetical protein [Patescibacteria group bacterium]